MNAESESVMTARVLTCNFVSPSVPGALCFICQSCSLQNLLVNRIQFMHSINHGTSPPLQVPLAAFAGTPEATSHHMSIKTSSLFSSVV